MAEFTEIWGNWQRMCHYQKDLGEGDCLDCPLVELECNSEYPKDQIHYDGKAIEEIITEWAETHKEPIYPSWMEYIVGIQPDCVKAYNGGSDLLLKWMLETPIPADKAEKLGLKPKEG